jgi:hypothetical protein
LIFLGVLPTVPKAFDYAEIREILPDGVIIQSLVTNTPEYLTFTKNTPLVRANGKDQDPRCPCPSILLEKENTGPTRTWLEKISSRDLYSK